MKNRFLTAALTAAMISGAAAAPAFAQDPAQQQQQQQDPAMQQQPAAPDPESITDDQVGSFVAATENINGVIEEYQPQVEEADEEQAMQLQQEAQEQMVVVVEETGLTVDEYNGIAAAAQSDEGLAERIRSEAGVEEGEMPQ